MGIMERQFQQIGVEREGEVFCVHLLHRQIDERGIHVLGNEVSELIVQDGCRWLIFRLGPGAPDCLYSVFLGKVIMVQRLLREREGALVLYDVSPEVMSVFEACSLQKYVEFAPDRAAALAAIKQKAPSPG
jgi:hypothetical protein